MKVEIIFNSENLVICGFLRGLYLSSLIFDKLRKYVILYFYDFYSRNINKEINSKKKFKWVSVVINE